MVIKELWRRGKETLIWTVISFDFLSKILHNFLINMGRFAVLTARNNWSKTITFAIIPRVRHLILCNNLLKLSIFELKYAFKKSLKFVSESSNLHQTRASPLGLWGTPGEIFYGFIYLIFNFSLYVKQSILTENNKILHFYLNEFNLIYV